MGKNLPRNLPPIQLGHCAEQSRDHGRSQTVSELWSELGNLVSSGYDGHLLQGQAYLQGNRLFFNSSASVEALLDIASVRTASKKDTVEEVMSNYNRPTEAAHLTKTAAYIRDEAGRGGPFILPAFILNVGTHSTVIQSMFDDDDFELAAPRLIIVEHPGVVQTAVLVLPAGIKLPVIDGAHRIKGFNVVRKKLANGKDADPMSLKRVMANAVPVIIGFEDSLAQVHQDFADCAQTKAMARIDQIHLRHPGPGGFGRSCDPSGQRLAHGTCRRDSCRSQRLGDQPAHLHSGGPPEPRGAHPRARCLPIATEYLQDDALTAFWAEVLTGLAVFRQLVSGASPSDVRVINGGSVWLKPAGLTLLARAYWHAQSVGLGHAELLSRLAGLDDALLKHGKTMDDWIATSNARGGLDVTKSDFVNPNWTAFWYTSKERASIRSTYDSVSEVWTDVVTPACGFHGRSGCGSLTAKFCLYSPGAAFRRGRESRLLSSALEPSSLWPWLLFIDESGHDHAASPYEVLAGVAIQDRVVRELIERLHEAEVRFFGRRYSDGHRELKGKLLLKRKVFRHRDRNDIEMDAAAVPALARAALDDGSRADPWMLKALALAKLNYVAFSLRHLRAARLPRIRQHRRKQCPTHGRGRIAEGLRLPVREILLLPGGYRRGGPGHCGVRRAREVAEPPADRPDAPVFHGNRGRPVSCGSDHSRAVFRAQRPHDGSADRGPHCLCDLLGLPPKPN